MLIGAAKIAKPRIVRNLYDPVWPLAINACVLGENSLVAD